MDETEKRLKLLENRIDELEKKLKTTREVLEKNLEAFAKKSW